MLATELIDELQSCIDRHGDCVVLIGDNDKPVTEVCAFDERGDTKGPIVEFSLFT